jgi:hypothetical protein
MSGTDVSFRPKEKSFCFAELVERDIPTVNAKSRFLHTDGRLGHILGNHLDVPQPENLSARGQ